MFDEDAPNAQQIFYCAAGAGAGAGAAGLGFRFVFSIAFHS
jgi:hypothetical protein